MVDNVLTDHARHRGAMRRGGPDARPETIDEMLVCRDQDTEQALLLRQARDRLEALHPRQAEVIRLRYIVGLTEDETAAALGISPETVKLDARKAKAFVQVILK
jgi:RNA polymerase sigma factor (sigma-70 family)